MKYSPLPLIACLAMLMACETAEPVLEEKDETPGEWMYSQRAWPLDTINSTLLRQERIKLQSKPVQRRSAQEEWQQAGPVNIGGRITDIALHPTDTSVIYAGASAGGLWRSMNGGIDWTLIFDEPGGLSIGDIGISTSDPEIIYIGTGEANASAVSAAFFGNGMYKSVDGGDTWEFSGLPNSKHIGRVVVDPTDADRVFVAVAGGLYTPGPDRGLYRTTDGGENWERILFATDSTSCIDVVIDPTDPDVLYAAMWERIRFPFRRSYGGLSSKIFKTTDGGDNWVALGEENGLPVNEEIGRIGLAISPTSPQTLYAMFTTDPVTNRFLALAKTTDGGENWSRVDDGTMGSILSSFGWFFGNVRVHPENPDQVYLLGLESHVSVNGGLNYQPHATGVHVDQHALEIHPQVPSLQVLGNDGGVYISRDAGNSWKHVQTLPVSQFYTCEADPQDVNRLFGGMQDNGTAVTPTGGINTWFRILGGDGFVVRVNPIDPLNIFAESQWGFLQRSENGALDWLDALNGIDQSEPTNWNTPYTIYDPSPNVMYYGTNRLYRSTDNARSWSPISGDLTDPILSARGFGTLSTIGTSESDPHVIYTGSDDGFVYRTDDLGSGWERISDDLPKRYVTCVAVDPLDAYKVYATFSGYRDGEYLPHVFYSYNGGEEWTDISSNLPEIPVNDLIVDPDIDGTLYLANDLGVWYTENNGETWFELGTGLPRTVVNDLTFHRDTRTLIAATYGRSMFTLELGEPSSTRIVNSVVDKLVVHPNPVSDMGHIRFETLESGDVEVHLFSSAGKLAMVKRQDISPGLVDIPIEMQNLHEGMYYFHLIINNIPTGSGSILHVE